MKLAELLAELGPEQLERLAAEHVRTDEHLSKPALCSLLEGTIRSFRFIQDFLLDRQPPAFVILTTLLDAPGYSLPTTGFREAVMAETKRLCELVDSGEILGRDNQLRLYRRVLYEARRSDFEIDASEIAILGVLRRELDIAQVEHFLLEHHSDLREFWSNEYCFLHELHALRSAGVVFAREGTTLLAEDVGPLVRQALGIDMATSGAQRLYAMLSNSELAEVLALIRVRSGGTKEERIERLLTHRVQPRVVLRETSLATLRDICRGANAPVSGSKEELVDRIILCFAEGRDFPRPDEQIAPPVQEERALSHQRFRVLFSSLSGNALAQILEAFPELRQSGTKETRVATLWESHRSERTLLSILMNRSIEELLVRLELRIGGSKRERIDRLISYFESVDIARLATATETDAQLVSTSDPSSASLIHAAVDGENSGRPPSSSD